MKKIGFLNFGHWSTSAHSQARSAADVLLQSIDMAVAAEELGADGAFFRVHHFARQLASPFPLLAAVGAKTRRIEIGTWSKLRRRAGCADRGTGQGRSHRSGRHPAADRAQSIGGGILRTCDRIDPQACRACAGMALAASRSLPRASPPATTILGAPGIRFWPKAVGAGLLANAVCHSALWCLTECIRQQAGSHRR